MDNSRTGSRDGTQNHSMDAIEIEPADPPFISPRPRGISESQNLLASPTSPDKPGTGQSENQTLLPNNRRNLFSYTTRTELKGFTPPPPEDAERIVSPLDGIPQTLVRTQRERNADLVVDIFAVGTAFPFYALAGVLIWVNGKEVETHQNNGLHQVTLVAGTMFPLCFSVVVGRMMVKLASWKLEQGASLGSLERLMGSRTVGGTLITQFKMGAFTVVALGLILLWIISPIGGQAVLRILSTTDGGLDSVNSTAAYVNSRQANYAGSSNFDSWFSGFAAQFSASLLAPEAVKNGTEDLWGNIKIPRFSSLENITPDSNGFRQIPQIGGLSLSYSSLFGIPVSDVPIGNTTFNLESSYMDLDCANITTSVARENGEFIDPGLISTNGPFRSAQDLTSSTPYAMGYLGDDVSNLLPNISTQSLDILLANTTNSTFLPGLLLYQDFTGKTNVTSIYCVPSQIYVESAILCTRINGSTPLCNVTAQRLSLQPHMPTTLTPLSMSATLIGLTSLLPVSASQRNNIDVLQNYLFNPLSDSFIQSTPWPAFDNSLGSNQESRFLNLPLSDFGDRLSKVINTFLHGSTLNSTSYLTNFNPGLTSALINGTQANLTNKLQLQSLAPVLTTQATNTIPTTPKYDISIPSIVLYLLSTTVLLLSALTSAYFTRNTISRDYLPYISSFLRDSAYVEFPRGAVRLDGFERSRIMRNLRLKLGDVGEVTGGWEIGTGVRVRVGRIGIGLDGDVVGLNHGGGGEKKPGGGRLFL